MPIGEVDGQVRDRTRAVADLLGSMRGYDVEIRDDMDAWLKYHACVTIVALGPAVCAAGADMERLARTRDLMLLSLRAMKEGFRGLRKHLGIRPAPRSFRLLELLPEPIWVWLLRSQLRTGKARSSIEGHSVGAATSSSTSVRNCCRSCAPGAHRRPRSSASSPTPTRRHRPGPTAPVTSRCDGAAWLCHCWP
ncbi:MAG: hypothetical protein EA388_04795 [Nitriliruptor sp.]|nr:MAG: hypothetical protein EA388_04795 [Nitriliruptor sp.]